MQACLTSQEVTMYQGTFNVFMLQYFVITNDLEVFIINMQSIRSNNTIQTINLRTFGTLPLEIAKEAMSSKRRD